MKNIEYNDCIFVQKYGFILKKNNYKKIDVNELALNKKFNKRRILKSFYKYLDKNIIKYILKQQMVISGGALANVFVNNKLINNKQCIDVYSHYLTYTEFNKKIINIKQFFLSINYVLILIDENNDDVDLFDHDKSPKIVRNKHHLTPLFISNIAWINRHTVKKFMLIDKNYLLKILKKNDIIYDNNYNNINCWVNEDVILTIINLNVTEK